MGAPPHPSQVNPQPSNCPATPLLLLGQNLWIVDKNFPRFQNVDLFPSFQKVMFLEILALPVKIKKLLAAKGLQKFNDS